MPPSEVEKLFRAFAEKRKAELPRFTPDGIPITMENKFDDAIYNYLYEYWKTNSGEYDPKKDVIPESEMNKMHPKTKNEFQFEKWLLQQYGMTNKEQREYTVKGNLESLWEIFSAADMVLFARGLPSIGKELAQLGKKAVDDVAEEAIEKTVKKEAAEEMAESTAKKDMADTTEDLSKETVKKEEALEDNSRVKEGNETQLSRNTLKHINNRHNPNRYAQQIKYRPKADVKAELENTTFFNKDWSQTQIKDAINEGYKQAIGQGITSGSYTFSYNGENVTVFLENGGVKTAYGDYTYTYNQLLNLIKWVID